jgi:hypothetical protein
VSFLCGGFPLLKLYWLYLDDCLKSEGLDRLACSFRIDEPTAHLTLRSPRTVGQPRAQQPQLPNYF